MTLVRNFLSIFFLSFISLCPLNFNKPGWIKSVHQVFILKNISYLVADYTGPSNHSVDVGMRMPVNPCVNPAVGYQFSVFTGKGAVQHGTSMMRSHCLECRQMVCNHHNMSCRTFFNAFLNKINTVLVHPAEFFHLQKFLVKLDLSEVIHAFPHGNTIVRVDP